MKYIKNNSAQLKFTFTSVFSSINVEEEQLRSLGQISRNECELVFIWSLIFFFTEYQQKYMKSGFHYNAKRKKVTKRKTNRLMKSRSHLYDCSFVFEIQPVIYHCITARKRRRYIMNKSGLTRFIEYVTYNRSWCETSNSKMRANQ